MTDETDETEDDADTRTTPTGLFHYAESYRTCAEALMRSPPRSLRFNDPMYFLAYHSLELYLKAYLRQHGLTTADVRKIGHKLTSLWDRSVSLGLSCELNPRPMMEVLDAGQLLRLRYIRTGMISRSDPEQLMGFLEQLRAGVHAALIARGALVRYEDHQVNGWTRA